MKTINFLLSIDTEEEWDWEGPFPDKTIEVDNIQQVPHFQSFLNQFGIKPSYFIDYAVIENPASKATLKQVISENPQAEVCAHLHPWVNPPIVTVETEAMSHIVNLPLETVKHQIQNLTQALTETFGKRPTSFRSGRWGINGEILKILAQAGYTTDSSIYPYFETEHFSCRFNSSAVYWPDFNNAKVPGPQRQILEIPVTAGYNRKGFKRINQIHHQLEQRPWRLFRPIGLLWQTRLLRKLYLSPELTQEKDLIALCKNILAEGYDTIHMYLHSSSLMPNAGSYVKTENDKKALLGRIESVVSYLKTQGNLRFMTIEELSSEYRKNL